MRHQNRGSTSIPQHEVISLRSPLTVIDEHGRRKLVRDKVRYSQVTNSKVLRIAEICDTFNVFTVRKVVEQLATLFATAQAVCLWANIRAGSGINGNVRSPRRWY